MNLVMMGINFRTARVELRERLSLRADRIPPVLQRLKRAQRIAEVAIVSTCNRTELYLAGPGVREQKGSLTDLLADRAELPADATLDECTYRKDGLDAADHLFRVAAGLESMVVGETEILGQVKQAYRLADEAGTTGRVLNPLFQNALKVGKRVRNETGICRGRISVSSIAVKFAERIFDDLSTRTVMIVGAGQTSERALQSLVGKGVTNVLVLNRSSDRGTALAERYGGKAIPFDLLADYLWRADIVISSTNAPHHVLRLGQVQDATARRSRPMLLIDIAVPCDIDREVGRLDNVYLYNIDDLQALAAENLAKRQDQLQTARSIVLDSAREFVARTYVEDVGPVIRRTDRAGGQVKDVKQSSAFGRGARGRAGRTVQQGDPHHGQPHGESPAGRTESHDQKRSQERIRRRLSKPRTPHLRTGSRETR